MAAPGKGDLVTSKTRTIILTIIGTLVAIGMIQNMRVVTVRFVVWDAGVPLSLFLVFVFGIGIIAGLFWRRR